MATSITWRNIKHQEFINSLTYENNSIAHYNEVIVSRTEELGHAKDLIFIFRDFDKYFSNQDSLGLYENMGMTVAIPRAKDVLLRTISQAGNNIDQHNSVITDSTNSKNYCLDRIAVLNEKIAAIEAEQQTATVQLVDVKKQLKVFSSIHPRNIKLSENGGAPFVQFVIRNIISEIDIELSRCPYIQSDFPKLSIPIPPVVVSIFPTNGEIHMEGMRGFAKYSTFRWDGVRSVHPHVLGIKPCLGDFAGPVREAINDLDWSTVATLLKLFLERVISNDTAGGQWSRYLEKPVAGWPSSNGVFYAHGRYGIIKHHKTPGFYSYCDDNEENPISHPHNDFHFPNIGVVDPSIAVNPCVDTTQNSN